MGLSVEGILRSKLLGIGCYDAALLTLMVLKPGNSLPLVSLSHFDLFGYFERLLHNLWDYNKFAYSSFLNLLRMALLALNLSKLWLKLDRLSVSNSILPKLYKVSKHNALLIWDDKLDLEAVMSLNLTKRAFHKTKQKHISTPLFFDE
ncbi:hypothetical protein TorRG33x02_324790 [Trema orientale]|uniref:Uncharacterized protein n=1 Tax=Trema orientale TaxID=63057 RepID=A0A2P5BDN3_TREOI|nr:hypothetical protein TorRG33x02_324790 [Trema orientale]